MLSVEEHLDQVLALAERLPAVEVPVGDGDGLVLAEDLVARLAVPPFDNSAMDGFAVRSRDLAEGVRLRVVGDIPAGADSTPRVGPGEAARIMTGAPVPTGADAVLPVEQTDQPTGDTELPLWVRVRGVVTAGRHIRRRGENSLLGETILRAGQVWGPGAGAAAAAVGYATVPLVRRPKVAVLSTGSELVPPGRTLGFGQIPDSNSTLMAGLARRFGAEVCVSRCVSDKPDEFRAALDEALHADLVITTGGVSVGAFEVVRQATEGEVSFVRVAMQPGKPQAFGRLSASDGRLVPMLGLPGNPVSAFVSAWVFVRPVVARMGGWGSSWARLRARAAVGWEGPSGRRQFLPVNLSRGKATPIHHLGSGSHLVASLHLADGLAVVDEQATRIEAGDEVLVHLTR